MIWIFHLDCTNAVDLGFEDSTINAEEISFENQEVEENETNRYIELLKYLDVFFFMTIVHSCFSQIQFVQSLREEIEKIDIYKLRHHPTSYDDDFGRYLPAYCSILNFFSSVDKMHQYTSELLGDSVTRSSTPRNRYTLSYYCRGDSTSSVGWISSLLLLSIWCCHCVDEKGDGVENKHVEFVLIVEFLPFRSFVVIDANVSVFSRLYWPFALSLDWFSR